MKKINTRPSASRQFRLNIIVLLVMTGLAVSSFFLLRTQLLKNAQTMGTSLTRNYAAERKADLTVYETLIDLGVASIEQQLENIEEEDLRRQSIKEWIKVYDGILQTIFGTNKVAVYAVYGEDVISAHAWEEYENYNAKERDWYKQAQENSGDVIFTDVYVDAVTKQRVITMAQKSTQYDAILTLDVFPANFKFHGGSIDLPEESSYFLCDSEGSLIYMQAQLQPGQKIHLQDHVYEMVRQIKAGEQDRYDSSIIDMDGRKRAVYYTIMDNGWISVFTIPYKTVLRELDQVGLMFGFVFFIYLGVVGLLSWRDFRMNKKMNRANQTVTVLGNSYYALYWVDCKQGSYQMVKDTSYIQNQIPAKGKYSQLMQAMIEGIEPEAEEEYRNSFSLENIRKLLDEQVYEFGGDFRRRFGDEYRWVSVRMLHDESLEPGQSVLCFKHVEEEKKQQLQERKLLENALEISRQSEKTKIAFFNNMSHDMRTPLNAIIGLTELSLKNTGNPKKTEGYLQKIGVASRQLLGLINDILDMSRIEQGKMLLDYQQFDLRQCIRQCTDTFRVQAETEHKNFSVECNIKDSQVLGDAFRITQIMNNLLSNAFKFTSAGDDIVVAVTQIERQESAKYQLVVRDTGIGMNKEFLPQLFQPYTREMRFTAQKIAGTGLGMPIVKNLVTQMSGQIRVESEEDVGTVFTIVLPLSATKSDISEKQEEKSEKQDAKITLKGKKILLAEDNRVNMEIAAEILTMNGLEVVQAWNGLEAVEQFRTAPPNTFDAILMDMQMPQMDGCEAAKQIRNIAEREDARTVPIIAVTANAFAEDIAATVEAGMNAHISKPIDFNVLCETLEELIEEKKRPPEHQN